MSDINGQIILSKEMFSENRRELYVSDGLSVETFKYSTGIEAVTLKNTNGYVTLLPYMGQQIWDMEFLGHNLVMKSIFKEPKLCARDFNDSYGCFLMHCGLTAMGNPTAEDTHLPHGELTIATYDKAYLSVGEDEKGKYIALSGEYNHMRAYEVNYCFSPSCRLYENATQIEMTVQFKNNKDLPLEYFYLCHINYRPVDGAKLIYTAKHEDITAHREVPAGHPGEKATSAYLDVLEKDISVMDTVDGKSQSYNPEIVFTCKYYADQKGDAYTMQRLPDGYSCYVSHKPSELPFGLRWISRTEDEDALGMVLPATAEHKGYLFCKRMGYERYLNKGETAAYHFTTGILSPDKTDDLEKYIKNIK